MLVHFGSERINSAAEVPEIAGGALNRRAMWGVRVKRFLCDR